MNALPVSLHFQLTRRCNLRCRMCGQWGEKGYQVGRKGEEMGLSDWMAVVEELGQSPDKPAVTFWGGEPLMAPFAAELAQKMAASGFTLSMVTNGILLERLAPHLVGHFKNIFVSVDGPPAVHDSIRGAPGLFEKTARGIVAMKKADPDGRVVVKTTQVGENQGRLGELAPYIEAWGVDGWSVGPQMFLSPARAAAYTAFTRQWADVPAAAESWAAAFDGGTGSKRLAEFKAVREGHPHLNLSLDGATHGEDWVEAWYDQPDEILSPKPCLSPWRRLSIQSDGTCSFCLDMSDGSLGSVREGGVAKVFASAKAVAFRTLVGQGQNPACARCIWKRHGEEVYRQQTEA